MIDTNLIFMNQNFTTQEQVFEFIAERAVHEGVTNSKDAVFASLKKRESEGTTGMMDGFAIPHAKDASIQEPKLVIITNQTAIEWNSMDGKGITFIISILIPDNEANTTHLKVLSTIARLLMREPIKVALMQATSAEEIKKVFMDELN